MRAAAGSRVTRLAGTAPLACQSHPNACFNTCSIAAAQLPSHAPRTERAMVCLRYPFSTYNSPAQPEALPARVAVRGPRVAARLSPLPGHLSRLS